MMNFNRKETQLEIFNTKTNTNEQKLNKFLSLFQYLVKFEKAIFSCIALVITFLIAFSVGFEKGKHINVIASKKSIEQTTNIAIKENAIKKDALNQNRENKKSETTYVTVVKKEAPKKLEQLIENNQGKKGAYVIQIASYAKDTIAKKEASILKNKGYNSLIKNKGKFIVVYVGNFSDKSKAEISLRKLKTNYRDCFIKKLS